MSKYNIMKYRGMVFDPVLFPVTFAGCVVRCLALSDQVAWCIEI